MKIKIKYFSKDYPRIKKIEKGDWIDLRVNRVIQHIHNEPETRRWKTSVYSSCRDWDSWHYKKGDVIKFGLGVAMQLPEGYEAEIRPRSSTFKKYGLIQTNSVGTIDNSYKGDNDEWMAEFVALRDGYINRFDRICQFRIWKNQPQFEFEEVDRLGNENRGRYGSTGRD